MKPEKCFPSKLWMNRGLGQEVGREKQGDERAGEGFQKSCVRVRQGRAWGSLSSGPHMAQGLVKVPQWQGAKNQHVLLESHENRPAWRSPVSFSERSQACRPSGNGYHQPAHPGDWSSRMSKLCILCPTWARII